MFEQAATLERDSIAIGEPLPFSVFSGDKLLLAKGQIVESERMRDHLVRVGRRVDSKPGVRSAANDETPEAAAVEDPFTAYMHDYNIAAGQSRIGARLSREDSSENYPCWVLGADDVHGLIITAPSKPDRSLLPISEGQTWVFRLLYLTAACKFSSTIRKVQFEPTPLLHVSLPRQVEMRMIRASPRVVACMRGFADVGKHVPMLINDIGVGGVSLAVDRAQTELRAGQKMQLSFSIVMLGVTYNFKVPATVTNLRSDFAKRYPALQFVGAKIDAQSEIERLVLHSYVYERTATDFNALWNVLLSNRAT